MLARMALKEYRAKRNFSVSPEPRGKAPVRRKNQLFFCVQKHLARSLHYDLRLEHNGVLLSWAVPKGPSLNPKDKRFAARTEDPFLHLANVTARIVIRDAGEIDGGPRSPALQSLKCELP